MDRIRPFSIPSLRLYSGAEIPGIGLGTFGSDSYSAREVADAVRLAADIGYRHFDCAACYGNQKEVGLALSDVQKNVGREELFITSKLWNDMHGYDNAILSCVQTMEELKLDYLDLFLIHWPFANYHPPGCPEDYHNPDARSYSHDLYMQTWRALEELHTRGLVRHIGTSNMTIPKLEMLLRDVDIAPAANEMEMHPTFQQTDLFDYCLSNEIVPIGYCPLGSPSRPDRDRTAQDASDLTHPVVLEIAQRHGAHPAEILLRWAVSRGHIPIPFSVKPQQMYANLKAATQRLPDEDMRALEAVECGNRLIKGQVFLWRRDQDWRDLWDEQGVVTR